MIDAIAAIGDAGDINCWSGIPYHFGEAARAAGFEARPWRLKMGEFAATRRLWNLSQIARLRGSGGYQYSREFLDRAEKAVEVAEWSGRTVTFNQHFPRARSVRANTGRLVHYIDATFASFCTPDGLAAGLPQRVRNEACALERDNYALGECVVTMARWAAESVVNECGVPPQKVYTILPGANLTLPEDHNFAASPGEPGRERPLVLGFVGKDWVRKGLPFLLQVRDLLERMGVTAVVRCAGNCPAELQKTRGLEYAGFIDKARDARRFVGFLSGCDVGCLFSSHEPLGISTLEFLRAGVPVAGFCVEGVADTLPPDAGFRFEPTATVEEVATTFWEAFREPHTVAELRAAARAWSPLVTWKRCMAEWVELFGTGRIARPVQLWKGPSLS